MSAGSSKSSDEESEAYYIIKSDDVKTTLAADKGSDAVLQSFTLKDFTKKGDNYACGITSVIVQYTKEGQSFETSYVVKYNPKKNDQYNIFMKTVFEKEIGFFAELLQMLNDELQKANEPKLRMPQYFHSVREQSKEVIYMEDLRRSGYKMYDRKKSMDKSHGELVVKELARLHSASVALLSPENLQGVNYLDKFPMLIEAYDIITDEKEDMLNDMFGGAMENTAKIIEEIEGYDYATTYLRENKHLAEQLLHKQFVVKDQFKVICHGDAWTNNFMFRYSDDGTPAECRLLDLQFCRVGSFGLDLNQLMFASFSGDIRRDEMQSLLECYYAGFASVMASRGSVMKFTMKEFHEEFIDKHMFGLLNGLLSIPIALLEAEDAPNFEEFSGEEGQKHLEEYNVRIRNMVKTNPNLRPRFLDMFDEMNKTGLFK